MTSEKAIGSLRQQARITKAGRRGTPAMTVRVALRCGFGVALLAALLVMAAQTAMAQKLTTLYSFTYGSNDYGPQAGLILDANGNLYGTTVGDAFGSVFEITAEGAYEDLYDFSFPKGSKNGYGTYSSLVRDADGNLFGTTAFGGIGNNGIIFQLTPAGIETVLYRFRPADGRQPLAGLVLDAQGNFYGTTDRGGAARKGVVFKFTPSGTETVLHSFGPKGSGDGENPFAGTLLMDAEGNLYGTTYMGGITANKYCEYPHTNTKGCGAVFKVSPTGQETVLYAFKGNVFNDGWGPIGGVVQDVQGNLYGTTYNGGGYGCLYGFGCGTVFKVTPDGTETILHVFGGKSDGALPYASLVFDAQGNLYGTTAMGGGFGCQYGIGCGTVFKVTPDGTETVLYTFTGGDDGGIPLAPLVFDGQGNLYGTTMSGGLNGGGTVFELTP